MPTTTAAGVNSHDIHANKSVTGADQPAKSPDMPANGPSFHLFGQLPPEIRLQIWETASFDLPSRVCDLNENMEGEYSNGKFNENDWTDPSCLLVNDRPSLRYVCHESRQVALKSARTIGWTVSGEEPPYRYFDPRSDVLYTVSAHKIGFMCEPRPRQYPGASEESIPVAAMRARQVRHIAISLRFFELVHVEAWEHFKHNYELGDSFLENSLWVFPRLEEISVAFSELDMAAFVASFNRLVPPRHPEHPCALETLARLEPTSAELPETVVGGDAHREDSRRSFYRLVKKTNGTFVEAPDIIASIVGAQRVPCPAITQVCQGTRYYNWEELPDTS